MNRKEQAHTIMHEANGHLLSEVAGPNKTTLEFWRVGPQIVIVQYFGDTGDCSHYVQGEGITWEAMRNQLTAISKS